VGGETLATYSELANPGVCSVVLHEQVKNVVLTPCTSVFSDLRTLTAIYLI